MGVAALPLCSGLAEPVQQPEPHLAASLKGRIVDAQTGEPLARVRVRLLASTLETHSDAQGRFALPPVPPGEFTMQAETVGYRIASRTVLVEEGAALEFEIALTPETFQRKDSVQVTADVFEISATPAPAETNLTGAEVKSLSTVLMDDPMRAVHVLPGVAANNDYKAQFSLRGAGFERMGIYLDDTLLHAPFHSIGQDEGEASLSILDGEMVAEMALLPVALPARYGDASAGVLQMRIREGSTSKYAVRIATGFAASSVLVEGPFAGGKGSWIGSVRKSYLRYMIDKLSSESSLGIGLTDMQGRVAYTIHGGHSVSGYVLDGTTDLDRTSARERSGVNALITGQTRSTLGKVSWQYTAPRLLVSSTASFLRDRFDTKNRYDKPMDVGFYGEWTATTRATWAQSPSFNLEAGWTSRRLRDDGFSFYYLNDLTTVVTTDVHRGLALRHGAYAEQSWRSRGGRVRATAGGRWDGHEFYSTGVWLPRASVAVRPGGAWDLQLGWGQTAQYPELAFLTSPLGGRRLLPQRANYVEAAVERRIGDNARFRVTAWDRSDRDLLARPLFDSRLVNNTVVLPLSSNLYNSARGYSRGLEFMLQRRSANRLSGWLSYTLSYSRQRDDIERQHYWTIHDQRHMISAFGSYRITSSVNLSGRWGYGSGEPVPGFVVKRDTLYYLSPERNAQRMPTYQRLDIRANKSFTYNRWKLTLYGEVINLTNHHNMRFISFDGVNTRTQRAYLTIDRAFPVVPLAGLTFEF